MSAGAAERVEPPWPASDGLTLIASFMLATAGLAHLSVAPAHFGQWWLFGALLLLAAALQLGVALAVLLRPSRTLFRAAIVLSVGLIAVWAAARTSGLPFGPGSGTAERVGLLDAVTVLDEAMLVALVALALSGPEGAGSRRLVVACEASGVALGVVLTLAFAGGVGHG